MNANDVPTAMMLIMKIKPDLILSDITMPNVDGFEFRKRVLENKELSNIPFVFLTSNDSDDSVLNGYDLSIEDYILKSTNPTILLKKIEAILSSVAKTQKSTVNELSDAAKEISSELMPEENPEFENYKIAKVHIPYNGIPGGDFIDYIKLNDDLLAVVVGDIVGKKWDAWFITFAFISYIRSSVRYEIENSDNPDPGTILQSVNKSVLADTNLANFFVNVSLILIDRKNNVIKYSGAGDLPLMQKTRDSNILLHKSEGINLGIREEGHYNTIEISAQKEDEFFVYTDGIIETVKDDNTMVGLEGLENLVKTNKNIKTVVDSVAAVSNNEFDDDLTLVSIKCVA